MNKFSQPRSLIDRQAFFAAVLLELGMIAFLMAAFQIFSFWVTFEAIVALFGGYGFSWLLALGLLILFGRRQRFAWGSWIAICVARGSMPALALVLPDLIDHWTASEPGDVGYRESMDFRSERVIDPIYLWGGLIWSLLGGLTYGSVWENGLGGKRARR